MLQICFENKSICILLLKKQAMEKVDGFYNVIGM